MLKKIIFSLLVLVLLQSGFNYNLDADSNLPDIESPEKFFGFEPGSDRNLFTYEKLIDYIKLVDKNSKRLKLIEIGRSPFNKPIYIAFISSEKNINDLNDLKLINRRLALDPNIDSTQRDQFLKEGKVFIYDTLSMHSGEVGPSQASPIIIFDLITTSDPLKLKWLDNIVLMMVPSHNPDGMNMVVNFYNKNKNTKYEGARMPGVYHKYVGHDNNRDFITLSQSDTKAIAAVYNLDWFPQVMVEKHQMGSTGVRYFVPPNHDPIAENIDEGIWNWSGIFGANMIKDMSAKKLAGVSQHYLFDDYWPGSTETCIWKNVIGFLTEAASVKYATPIYIEPNELNVYGKGLSEYKKSINMPLLWKGGWWKLSDIVKYEIASTMSILKTASLHRYDILKFRNDICKKEVMKGKDISPFFYIIPRKQHDESELVNLINLLFEHGVNVYDLNREIAINNRMFNKGDLIIPLSQPFRAFIKEVMEKQNFPERHYTPGGKLIKPYDITSWSLPVHRGIKSIEIKNKRSIPAGFDSFLHELKGPFSLNTSVITDYFAIVFPVSRNESYNVAFEALQKGIKVFRLKTDHKYSGNILKKGSFLIYGDKRLKNKLNNIIGNLNVKPVYIEESMSFEKRKIKLPRIALIETIFHDMDAGWTRYVFDTYHIPFKILRPVDLLKTDLQKQFDVIVIPDSDKNLLMKGKRLSRGGYNSGTYLPELSKGFGKKGLNRLLLFLENGGTVISWRKSTALFMGPLELDHGKSKKESFTLPVSDIFASLKKRVYIVLDHL